MKHLTTLPQTLALALTLALPLTALASPITPQRAADIARHKTASLRAKTTAANAELRRVETTWGDLVYIFETGDDGLIIVSGDDCLPQTLAIIEHGRWADQQTPTLTAWIDGYAQRIAAAQVAGMPTRTPRTAAGTRDIAPMTKTKWHQDAPYNNLCPYFTGTSTRSVTGCVATAACQVLYYWYRDMPDKTSAKTPTYNTGDAPVKTSLPTGTPVEWALMQLEHTSSMPTAVNNAVATLMAAVGASSYLTYEAKGTGGDVVKLLDAMRNLFKVTSTFKDKRGCTQEQWEELIITDLEAGRPIVYRGQNDVQGGHAVVLDGYRLEDNLFHFNFGFGGTSDGWYTVDDYTGMNNFPKYQQMVYQIEPKTRNVEATVELHPAVLYKGSVNTVTVQLTNQSTLPWEATYLYVQNAKTPQGDPVAADTETTVKSGKTATLTFGVTPDQSLTTCNIFVCDAKKTVLGKLTDVAIVAGTVPAEPDTTTYLPHTSEGWTDCTSLVANPSFEQALDGTWEVTKSTGNVPSLLTANSALTNYMGHADGSKVLNFSYNKSNAPAQVEQTIAGLKAGYYTVRVGLAAADDIEMLMVAKTAQGSDTLQTSSGKYSAQYLVDQELRDVHVTDGQMTLSIGTVDGKMRVDNVRLYLTKADEETGVETINDGQTTVNDWHTTTESTVFDLQGHRHSNRGALPQGVYIVNGHKVLIGR